MTEAAPEPQSASSQRTIGLWSATGVGVGAIVGGGVMVLAGAFFAVTGPGALLVFVGNGLVAFVTAMSFAEIGSAFPESGGAYMFAKKVMSVRAAFAMGWILWFAYIVAGVLYALGFAAFTVLALHKIWEISGGTPPDWLEGRRILLLLSTLATAAYSLTLIRRASGGGQLATIGKVVVFAIIILVGAIAVVRQPVSHISDALTPFLTGGPSGVLIAMGLSFIALQGFDLISAIGGEVKSPERNIPRAMFLSLGIALAVYLPLLFVVAVAGVGPGESIADLARVHGDTVFADAVSRFMGPVGYWLIIVAAILSTLSALHANILAASRIALSMARDRALPRVLGKLHDTRKTPVMAIYATALTLVAILFMVPNLGAAGAAASLIFLISFALTHLTVYLARVRGGSTRAAYRTPLFPLIPVAGGLACAALAVFQAVMVPDAGAIAAIWLGLGIILYIALFKSFAETADASQEAFDPSLAKLRGKTPLVLLPVANPKSARSLVAVANSMAPSEYARVLLLTIVPEPRPGSDILPRLEDAQTVVREALLHSFSGGNTPEALITAAENPWEEIQRIAKEHDCESLLLGLGAASPQRGKIESNLEDLINEIDCDVAIMRAADDWQLAEARRVLVPVGGRGFEHSLRARVLSSICRSVEREITFVTVLPTSASEAVAAETLRNITGLSEVKVRGRTRVEVLRSDDPVRALLDEAGSHDLVVLGLKSARWGRRVFGEIALRIARESPCAAILLSAARTRAYQRRGAPAARRGERHPVAGRER